MEMSLNAFSKEVHANACKHGWWAGDKSYGELIALFHSELSEAFEEYRANRMAVWYGEDGKPEGIAVELIDCVIRILDYFAAADVMIAGGNGDTIDGLIESLPPEVKEGVASMTFPDLIAHLHSGISSAYEKGDEGNEKLLAMMAVIFYWIMTSGENPEDLLKKKHEYNKTRPYRHGGKIC